MFIFAPIRWSIRIVELVILGLAGYLVVSAVQVVLASRVSSDPSIAPQVNAIIEVGAQLTKNALSTDQLMRLRQTAKLFVQHKATTVYVTGPVALAGAPAPAAVAQSWLASDGVSSSAIHQVTAASTSSALAASVKEIGGVATVIVVTDAVNTLWTRDVVAHDGDVALFSPPSASKHSFFSEPGGLFRQASAIALGRIVGYGRIGWAGN